jgi:hypothetical protein
MSSLFEIFIVLGMYSFIESLQKKEQNKKARNGTL